MKIKDRLMPVITVAVILLLWFVWAAAYDKEILLPSPRTTFAQLIAEMFGEESGRFWSSVWQTLLRSVVSFIIAFILALVLALTAVKFNTFYKLFYPVVVFLRALPTIAVIFVCYIAIKGWFRAVLISFLVIFPTLFASFYTSVKGCSVELKEVATVYGVQKRHVLLKLIIPSVWASMYSEVVNTLSLTVKLIIAAEAVTSTGLSLGGLMAEAKAMFEMGRILAYTVVAVCLSYLTEIAVRIIVIIVNRGLKICRLH